MMSKDTYTSWDSAEFLGDDESVVEYLQAALEENDPAFFVKAIGNVARAKGMSSIAQTAQLGRQNLYKALSGERDPRIGTLMKSLDTLGVRLTVVPNRCGKEIESLSFADANGDPEALHGRTTLLLEELARRTGLDIRKNNNLANFDPMGDGKCLHRPGKIAEKIRITSEKSRTTCSGQNLWRLWVNMWPAETVAQADCFYKNVDSESFLALKEQGWTITPNSGFHFAKIPLFGSGTSLDARGHMEYFFSGKRPYGKYYYPGNGGEGKRELTLRLIESWQRNRVIGPEARSNIEQERDCSNHRSIVLKPGFWLYRTWELEEVIELEKQGELEARLIETLDTSLATWGESL